MLLSTMYRNAQLVKEAENIINATIKSGQYVAIEMENGTYLRLDKPIKIHNIELVVPNVSTGKYEEYNFND